MALVDMKMDAEEAKEQGSTEVGSDAPAYPYGLEIRLDDGSLAKLGMTSLPKVGTKVQVSALATVVSTSQRSDREGESESSVCLQITAMEVGGAQETQTAQSTASLLYGE